MNQTYNEINISPDGTIDLTEIDNGLIVRSKNFLINVKIIKFGYDRIRGVQIQMNSEESYYYDSGDEVMNFSIYDQLRELRKNILTKGYKRNGKV